MKYKLHKNQEEILTSGKRYTIMQPRWAGKKWYYKWLDKLKKLYES